MSDPALQTRRCLAGRVEGSVRNWIFDPEPCRLRRARWGSLEIPRSLALVDEVIGPGLICRARL